MKKIVKIVVPILMVLGIVSSIIWYLLVYDRDFTQSLILKRARAADSRGNYAAATWYYNLAYRHSHEDELVAIELAEQFKSIGNYTKAEYTLSNAIADGGGAQLYAALCKTYVEQDKLRDAVAMLDNIADPAIKAELDAQRPLAPEATPEDGYYNEYIDIEINSESGSVYVTTNGEYPSLNNPPLNGSLKLEGGETVVYALTVGDNGLVSPLKVMGYTIAGVIEEVSISDSALNSIVRDQLNASESHTLFTNELWNITSLEITAEVKDLSELSKMPFLEHLTIPQGKYTNLSVVSVLPHLQSLDINGVTLTTDEVNAIASLPDLRSLSLVRCNLSSISELAAASGLTNLNLSNNTIRDLQPLSSLSNLEVLNLSHNAITQLTALTGASKLRELDVSFNSVNSTVALSGCKNLETLSLNYNALTNLEGLEKLTNLRKLSANHNQITNLHHLGNATQMTELDVSNNVLTDLAPLKGLYNLVTLKFPNNQVTVLPSFTKECVLSTIDGSHNKLTSLEPLYGLKNLNYVMMDYNGGISSVNPLSSCTALVEVSVFGTGVTDVSALTKMNVIVKYAPVS